MQTRTAAPNRSKKMEMPEEIFADPPSTFDGSDVWHSQAGAGRVKYIRADLLEVAMRGAYEEGYNDGRDPYGPGV